MLVYHPAEFSFDTVPSWREGYASLLVNDLNLEMNDSRQLIAVWGLCPHLGWHEASLSPPEAAWGEVHVTGVTLQTGISKRLSAADARLPVKVDMEKGWIAIQGKVEPKLSTYMSPGVILQIGAAGEFAAIWLHPAVGLLKNGYGRKAVSEGVKL